MSQMFLNVVSTFKGDGLAAATRQLGAFGKQAGGLGGTLGKVGAALASFGIAAKAIQFTQSSIESARDLERNLFSVDVIFGELAPKMVQFTKDAEEIGLSQKDAAKAVTFLGSVLKQSGFEMDEVAVQSEKLVSLGVDLAATYGYDVSEALLGMTALFRGEYDPIEKFGVAMKQAEINAELQARGLHKLTGAALRNAEQTIRMELLYERAADASGAFTAQTGNLFVEQKKLSAQFENMQATVGTALLPAMGDLVQTLVPLVDEITPRLIQVVNDAGPALQTLTQFMKDLGDETTTTGSTASFIADTLGTFFRLVAENFGTIVQLALLIGGLRVAFTLLTIAMNATPLGWALTGAGLLAAGFILVKDAVKDADDALYNYNVQLLQTDPVKQAIAPYMVYEGILGDTASAYNRAAAEAYGYKDAVNSIPELDLTQHQTELTITSRAWRNMLRAKNRAAGNVPGFTPSQDAPVEDEQEGAGAGAAAKKQLSGLPALIAEAKKNVAIAKKETALMAAGLSEATAKWITSSSTPIKASIDALVRIAKNGDVAIRNLTKRYLQSAAGMAAAAQAAAKLISDAEAEEAAEAAAAAERAARLAEQKRVYESFLDSIKSTFGGIRETILNAFNLPSMGGSTNSVLRNMEKMLTRLRSFSASIKQLASMGLDPALLQQIISMGPMAGARFAANLVAGGAQGLTAINAGFGEFGSLASEIATTGTRALFGTQAQANVFNINVSGGVGSGATIGQAIVEAIKAYERVSGAVWQGA